MPKLRMPLFLITVGFFSLTFFPSLWVAVPALLLFFVAVAAWITSLIVLPTDPQRRVWTTHVKYVGDSIYKWDWQLEANGDVISRFKSEEDRYGYMRNRGKTETRLGALWEAAIARRDTIRAEKRDAKSGKTISYGQAKNSAETQQRNLNPVSAYFRWVENLLNRNKEKS